MEDIRIALCKQQVKNQTERHLAMETPEEEPKALSAHGRRDMHGLQKCEIHPHWLLAEYDDLAERAIRRRGIAKEHACEQACVSCGRRAKRPNAHLCLADGSSVAHCKLNKQQCLLAIQLVDHLPPSVPNCTTLAQGHCNHEGPHEADVDESW